VSRILEAFGIDATSGQGAAILASYANKQEDIPQAAIAFLVDLFHKARTAGVTYTLADFAAMHPVEREAARLAGERWEAAQALLYGRAAKGGLDSAAVASIIDGGELLEAAMLEVDSNVLAEVKQRTTEVMRESNRKFREQHQHAAAR
jgi:hypothetical protein